jgi:hypothetical protein
MSNKKAPMKYIRKPIIIVPTILLLFIGGIITIFKYDSLGVILLILSIGLMIISFIEALISKKWLKGVLYFIFYTLTLTFSAVFLWLSIMFIGVSTPTKGTSEFYNNKLNYHLESNEPVKLATFCKQDEFYEDFEGDLNASCIFKLNDKEYEDLISEIKNNKKFVKGIINISSYPIELEKLECSKKITFKKNGYSSAGGATIVFSSDNKYCSFNLYYL